MDFLYMSSKIEYRKSISSNLSTSSKAKTAAFLFNIFFTTWNNSSVLLSTL